MRDSLFAEIKKLISIINDDEVVSGTLVFVELHNF
jgi:hypothetical protein